MSLTSALDLLVPRNITALLQHLQRLVGVERHRQWCGGVIAMEKLGAFVHKMEQRYPLCRSTRERSYDRRRGRAVVHLVVYPLVDTSCAARRARAEHDSNTASALVGAHTPGTQWRPSPSMVAWWLVSGPGAGGLLDASTPDAHVSRDAMSANGHIRFSDYVLLYATKKEPHSIVDPRTGRTRVILKDTSTWTWKLCADALKQIRASVDDCCNMLEYGAEPSAHTAGWGLLGLLAAQRSRPLFSGVRTQILQLHRNALDSWESRRSFWLSAHPEMFKKLGPSAGSLLSVADLLANELPKMRRVRVWGNPSIRIRDLLVRAQ